MAYLALPQIMTQNASFYWKPAKNKKNKKQTNKKTNQKKHKSINKQKNKTKSINKINKQNKKQYSTHGLKLREALCFSLIAAACWYHLLKSTVCCVACCQAATQTPKIQQGLPSQSFKQCAYYPWWGQAISPGGAPAARGTPFFCGTFFLGLFLFFSSLGKTHKKTTKKSKKQRYHEPPGHPVDWLLAPIKGNRRTVWSFD